MCVCVCVGGVPIMESTTFVLMSYPVFSDLLKREGEGGWGGFTNIEFYYLFVLWELSTYVGGTDVLPCFYCLIYMSLFHHWQ